MYFVLIVAILFAGLACAQEQSPQQTPDAQQQTQTSPSPESPAKTEPEPQAQQPQSPQAEQPASPQTEQGSKQDATGQPQSPQAEQPASPQAEQGSKQAAPKQPQVQGKKAKPHAKKRPAKKPTAQHAVRKSKSRKHTATAHAKTAHTKTAHTKTAHTKGPEPPSSTSTDKVVVRNGGARDTSVDLAPQLSKEQAQQERESAAALIGKTENNLKVLESRQLNKAQQGMLEQIHAYLQQAKSASDSGDVVRANTLAFKAQLLSEDLLKN